MKFIIFLSLLSLSTLHAEVRGWWDIAPQEYPDLAPQYREVPEENNGLKEIVQITEKLSENNAHKKWKRSHKRNKKVELSPQLIEQHKKAYKALQAALEKEIQSEYKTEMGASYSDEIQLMNAAEFLSYSAMEDAASDTKAALKKFTLLHKLARKSMQMDGGLVNYLVANAIYGRTFTTAIDLCAHPKITSAEMQQILTILTPAIDSLPRFQNAINFESVAFERLVKMAFINYDVMLKPEDSSIWRFFQQQAMRFLMQPNRTIEYSAAHLRAMKLAASKPFQITPIEVKKKHTNSLPFSNIIGRKLVETSTKPLNNRFNERKLETAQQLTKCYIALLLHWKKHKNYPEDLRMLVPEHLPALPIDPYSGKPLHYSKEKKRVWSVGNDLKNNNGFSQRALDLEAKPKKKRKKKKRAQKPTRRPIKYGLSLNDDDEPHIVLPF